MSFKALIFVQLFLFSVCFANSVSNFLVVTSGWNGRRLRDTETLSIGNNDEPPQYPFHPRELSDATGGFIGEDFVTCGGIDSTTGKIIRTEYCYKLGIGAFAMMTTVRFRAASIVLEDEFALWVLGGIDRNYNTLSSTEIVYKDGRTERGPDMPLTLWGHKIVKINDTTSLLVGGYTGSVITSKWTWYFNGNWIRGPDLITERCRHSLGIVQDIITMEKYIVVAGGHDGGTDTSVEIMSVSGTTWETGKLFVALQKFSSF